ncbi:unnamed protein product [marine sediment metagenome]|uniref:Uncharacterized protein n=1 Tax=marine sediment metagenome TaxID=412755 RepID=X1DV93_9ZZZZ
MFEYANRVTGGWHMILFLAASSLIIFGIMKIKQYRTSDSLLVSNFITFILGSFIWAAGLIAGKIIVLFLLLTLASGIYAIFDKE